MLVRAQERTKLRQVEEKELVGLARLGDQHAIRLLVADNNQRLFRVARSVLRDDVEAEDVVQETYLKAFSGLDEFRDEARFATWLTRIALNEAIGRIRKRKKSEELGELDLAISADAGLAALFPLSLVPPNAESEADRGEMRAILERAIDGLPEPFRIVFVLRDVQGMSIEETAAHLDLVPETVRTRLHRARRRLRAYIAEKIAASFSDLFPFDGARCVHLADRVLEQLKER